MKETFLYELYDEGGGGGDLGKRPGGSLGLVSLRRGTEASGACSGQADASAHSGGEHC